MKPCVIFDNHYKNIIMKPIKWTFLLFTSFLFTIAAQAQTVDEIINKHIEAIGGKENWLKVNTFKMEANISVQGMEIPVNIFQIHNKASKQEYTVMNMTGYTILTSEAGWSFNPMMGQSKPEPMTKDDVELGKESLDIQGDMLDYAAKGSKAELMGKEDVDGTSCYKLKLTRKSGNEYVYFIDPSNYYIIRSMNKVKANGQEVEQKVNFSNYQKLPEGIVVPLTMENSSIPAPINVKKVEVNAPIDESVFKVAQ
jgi:hypothetical protein